MAYLFTVQNKTVIPFDETIQIPPFKEIWERDISKGKENAIEDFTYIEFIASRLKTNPYRGYSDEIRKEVVQRDIITRKDWEEDELITEGIKKLEEFQTKASPSYSLYEAALKGKSKLEKILETIDLTATNDKGTLLYKPRDLSSAILDIDKVTASLSSLKKKSRRRTI